MKERLSIRSSHKYVGTYAHLDDWEDIGTVTILHHSVRHLDETDICDPCEELWQVTCDDSNMNTTTIRNAICDTFTKQGCAHEYDCCGCRSVRVKPSTIKRYNNTWLFTTTSSRNY